MSSSVEGFRMAERSRPTRSRFSEWGSWVLACIESLADGVVVTDEKGTIVFVNRRVESMLGFARNEMLGQKVEMLLPERHRKIHTDHRAEFHSRPARREMGTGLELLARRKDGAELPVEVSLSPMDTEEGPVVVSTVREISERIAARRALADSEERALVLLENIPDGVALIADKKCVYVNAALCRMTGWSQSELSGKPVILLVAPGDRGRALSRLEELLSGSPPEPREYRLLQRDGGSIPVEAFSRPVPHEGGVALLGIFRDIAKRRYAAEKQSRLEARLRHLEKLSALGALAAGVAHDFNNILQSIFGYAGMVLEFPMTEEDVRTNIEKIIRVSGRGRDLVQRLLDLDRRIDTPRRPLDLGNIVEGALASLRPSFPSNVQVRFAKADRMRLVHGDPAQLHEVITNLLSNSRDAVKEVGGTIEISLRELILEVEVDTSEMSLHPGAYLLLRIRDSGKGFDRRARERVFEPFFTTKPIGEGAGLGLAVVHAIVSRHGGAVAIESRPGRGTSVDVYLPLSSTVGHPGPGSKKKMP
jgi:PAS domain S-box-containing protein